MGVEAVSVGGRGFVRVDGLVVRSMPDRDIRARDADEGDHRPDDQKLEISHGDLR
jgi:hypothetical protein